MEFNDLAAIVRTVRIAVARARRRSRAVFFDRAARWRKHPNRAPSQTC